LKGIIFKCKTLKLQSYCKGQVIGSQIETGFGNNVVTGEILKSEGKLPVAKYIGFLMNI
jgi:hypothetical protein